MTTPQPRRRPGALPSDRAHQLARRLRERIDGEVRFDPGSRALYATDGSLYRQPPIGVVLPRHADDVVATVALCREFGAPVLSRGAGTSLAGQCCNTAVVIDFSKYMNRVIALDPQQRSAVVEPGCVLDDLREQAEQHGLTFGPDPATHRHNTLGGMLGNNSCGIHSIMAGRTADNVIALEILTYDGQRFWVGGGGEDELRSRADAGGREGEIFRDLLALRERCADAVRDRFPDIPRRVSGYCLEKLLPEHGSNVGAALVGSEGTCVVVLQARLRLVPSPRCRTLLVLGYPDIHEAADAVPDILAFGPIGCEGVDSELVRLMRKQGLRTNDLELLPDGHGWLFVEFGGDDQRESDAAAERLAAHLRLCDAPPRIRRCSAAEQQRRLWSIREAGLGATAQVPGEPTTHPGWEDAAVAPTRLGAYLREFRALLDRYGYHCALYGHFGDGCVHCRIDFDMRSVRGVARWRQFMDDAADLVVAHGGSFSGEHGDGQLRASLLPKLYGVELVEAFREFKRLWDPDGAMNPGKVIDPYPIDADLRLSPELHLPKLQTRFTYPDDRFDFANATLRCVGVGQCRDLHDEVMCPSYRGTREEMHSTRGRARLLFEMMKGELITDGFDSQAVHDALHLCLACKACKRDCPVDVDMATWKAEFMARHYRRRLRPRDALSMGLIFWWARIGAHAPGLINALTRNDWSALPLKRLAGIAAERRVPRFASPDFRREFHRRPASVDGRPVVLFADTFGNHFDPGPLRAAAAVLRASGYAPWVTPKPVCCARPLYAEGMLDLARAQLRNLLDALAEPIARDWPVVGVEPACVASLVDELPRLFPHDARASHLARHSFLLADFLRREGIDLGASIRSGASGMQAVMHAHCIHHADFDPQADRELLASVGVPTRLLDAGCCGMAGSFGMSADRFELSLRIGEHALMPALRGVASDRLWIASGFSCREQIEHCTGRRPLDLAEVLQQRMAA